MSIYDARGSFFQGVRNHVGAWDESPFTVSLPPGRYTMKAESKFDGDVAVPVIIQVGRTTVVDLQHRDYHLVDDNWVIENVFRDGRILVATADPQATLSEAE